MRGYRSVMLSARFGASGMVRPCRRVVISSAGSRRFQAKCSICTVPDTGPFRCEALNRAYLQPFVTLRVPAPKINVSRQSFNAITWPFVVQACRDSPVFGRLPEIAGSRQHLQPRYLGRRCQPFVGNHLFWARYQGSSVPDAALGARICHRTGAPLSAPFLPYRTPTSHTPAPRPLPGVPAGSFPGYAGTYAFVEALSQSAGNTTHGVFSRGAI